MELKFMNFTLEIFNGERCMRIDDFISLVSNEASSEIIRKLKHNDLNNKTHLTLAEIIKNLKILQFYILIDEIEKKYKKTATKNIDFIFINGDVFIDVDFGLLSKQDILTLVLVANTSIKMSIVYNNSLYMSIEALNIWNLKGGFEFNGQQSNNEISNDASKTYLMLNSKGYVKIGKSKNPIARERTLQAEAPDILLFAVCDNDIENHLHKEFSNFRVRGEWFNLNKIDILAIIEKYNFKIINN